MHGSRRTGERAIPAATVYSVKNDLGDKRHFTVSEDGKVAKVSGYEQGFDSMLLEPNPARAFEHRGKVCHPYRYSLCWAPFDLYNSRSAP